MTVIIESIKVAELAEAVAAASTSLPSRPNPPIMGALLIETDQNASTLTLSSYDYDQASRATVTAAAVEAAARIAVSGKLLGQVVKVAPKREPLVLDVGPSALTIRAGRTEFTLPLMDVEDYPDLPDMAGAEILGQVDAAALAAAVALVDVAADKSSDAPNITQAIMLEADGDTLTLAATNRFTLLATTEVSWSPHPASQSWNLRLKADELAKATKVFADGDRAGGVIVKQAGGMVALSASAGEELHVDSVLSVFDCAPPQWRRLFDYPVNTTIEAGTAELVEVARRAVAVGDASAPGMLLRVAEGGIDVTVGAALIDGVELESFDGEPIDYLINQTYLRNALSALGASTVRITLSAVGRPIMISDAYASNPARILVMGIRQ